MASFKKILFLFLFFWVGISCENEAPTTSQNYEEPDLLQIADYVGNQHNLILDHILNDLESKKEPFKDKIEIKNFFKNSISKYLITNNEIKYPKKNIAFQKNFSFIENAFNSSDKDIAERVIEGSQIDLNRSQQKYLRDVFYKVKENQNSSESNSLTLQKRLKLLNEEIVDELPKNEALPIIMTSKSILKSHQYWETYKYDWTSQLIRLFPNQISMNSSKPSPDPVVSCPGMPYPGPCIPMVYVVDWQDVAIADGGGVIAGAAYAGVEAAFLALAGSGPPGWVAAGATVGASAAAFSAYSVYSQIIEAYT